MKVAQKVLGAPNWQEVCLRRKWWWRELKEANQPPASGNTQKSAKNVVLCSTVLKKIY
jgi:hypothetical protein